MSRRSDILKETYRMERHVEGGFFSEVYTAPFAHGHRPLAGSIFYLLDAGEVFAIYVLSEYYGFIRSTAMRSGISTRAAA